MLEKQIDMEQVLKENQELKSALFNFQETLAFEQKRNLELSEILKEIPQQNPDFTNKIHQLEQQIKTLSDYQTSNENKDQKLSEYK